MMKVENEIAGYKVHPAAQKFPPMDDGEFDALCIDIAENGLIDPIVRCEYEGETVLLDGRHRLTACLQNGMELDEIDFIDYEGETPVSFVISKNKHRRHLKISQLAMIAAELKEMYEVEAKERMSLGGKGGIEENENDNEGLDEGQAISPDLKDEGQKKSRGKRSTRGQSRDKAGAAMGVSGRSVSRAQKVIDGGCDELQEAVRNGKIDVTIGEKIAQLPVREQRQVLKKIRENPGKNPNSVFRKHKKDRLVRRIKSEPQPPPEGPFRVIVADPAWQYEKHKDDGTQRGQTPYPTMTIKEVMDLVDMINGFAADNCILWLWGTNAHIADGTLSSVLDVWEFEGKTVLTWEKPKIGTGDWLRGKTEHCIMAVRGKPIVDLSNESTIIHGAVREHSRKPEEFYQLVEKLCPGSKLEMFATEERPGWRIWAPGNWRQQEEERVGD